MSSPAALRLAVEVYQGIGNGIHQEKHRMDEFALIKLEFLFVGYLVSIRYGSK